MIGSANLTDRALGSNEEISLVWKMETEHPLVSDLQAVFVGFRNKGRCEKLNEILLAQYRQKFKIAEDAKKRVEKAIADEISEIFDLEKLESLHDEFIRDRDEVAALKKRRLDRSTALEVQNRIVEMAGKAKLSRNLTRCSGI